MAKPIPDGYNTISTSLTFKDSKKALDFYQKAFGAKVTGIFPSLDGKGVMHAAMTIGDSTVMMGDEMPGSECKSAETLGATPITLWVYTQDVDAFFKRAIDAGAKETMPVGDQFWGDRMGQLKDPFGYCWGIATHKQDLTPEQVRAGAEKFFASMAGKGHK